MFDFLSHGPAFGTVEHGGFDYSLVDHNFKLYRNILENRTIKWNSNQTCGLPRWYVCCLRVYSDSVRMSGTTFSGDNLTSERR